MSIEVYDWRKSLRGLDDRFVGRRIAQQPSADEFAVILQTLFDGKPSPPREPAVLTENAWTLSELTTALAKMKANKSGDDSGIVFFFFPRSFLDRKSLWLLDCFTGQASVRVLYKVFTYMVLGRVEPALEASQPEEQHRFRRGRRLGEHLASANLVIDKSLPVGKPVWIVSLDCCKAFG